MHARIRHVIPVALALLAGPARASSPLEATHWGVVYDTPATRKVRLEPDVPYLVDARDTLTLDLHHPPGKAGAAGRPAVVFLNGIGDRPGYELKRWTIYRSWARLVAAHGMVGITMDAAGERIPESLAAVFRFLERHGARHGIDASRLGVYAASANVREGTAYLMGPQAARGIRAAALYYGRPTAHALRRDLPVLFVIAESDTGGGQRAALVDLWARAVATGAPWTVSFGTGLPHAFDAFSDRDDARRLILQTLEFWRTHLQPVGAAAPVAADEAEGRSILEASFSGNTVRAESLLARWIGRHPEDGRAYAQRGGMLLAQRRLDEAAAMYEGALARGVDDAEVLSGFAYVRIAQQRWAEAVDLLGRAIAKGADDSRTHGNLGWAQLQLGRNEEAVRSYERAFEAGIPPGAMTRGVASYNLACGYARIGRKGLALDALARAAEEGFGDRAAYASDPDLEPLRGEARYREILERLPASPSR